MLSIYRQPKFVDPHDLIISGSFLTAVGVIFIFALFRELRFRIDRQQISHTSHLLGLKWNNSKPAPRQEICQLEIEQLEYKQGFPAKKLRRVNHMIIQAGNQKYQLGLRQKLSKSEIEWLATELSQWLGLRIQRTLTDGKKNILM